MIKIAAMLLLAITVTLTGCETLKLKKIPPGQAKKMALEL